MSQSKTEVKKLVFAFS